MKSPKVIDKAEGVQALAHRNNVSSQLLKLISGHEFENLANQYQEGQKLHKLTHWAQLAAMTLAQLSGRANLWDVVDNLFTQAAKPYYLGSVVVSRSSLARVNEQKSYTLHKQLARKLLVPCLARAPRYGFRFKNELNSLNILTFVLCLSAFPWARSRTTKAAVKLHLGSDHEGMLPVCLSINDSKANDITSARPLQLPKGSIVVMDRGSTDYAWYHQLHTQGILFVARLGKNARYQITERRCVLKSKGLTSDQTIQLGGTKARNCPRMLRRIGFKDGETGKPDYFLTYKFDFAAPKFAEIFKTRWYFEPIFKWIKQNLKSMSLPGRSRNAVMTKIRIAICVNLLLAYREFVSRIDQSMQQILRFLQLNLFERRDLRNLRADDSPLPPAPQLQTCLRFS